MPAVNSEPRYTERERERERVCVREGDRQLKKDGGTMHEGPERLSAKAWLRISGIISLFTNLPLTAL